MTWQAMHAARGHDGGHTAAHRDGANEWYTPAILQMLWEAQYEPPWDIAWDRVQGESRRLLPPPPRTGTDEPWFLPPAEPLRPPQPPPTQERSAAY